MFKLLVYSKFCYQFGPNPKDYKDLEFNYKNAFINVINGSKMNVNERQ